MLAQALRHSILTSQQSDLRRPIKHHKYACAIKHENTSDDKPSHTHSSARRQSHHLKWMAIFYFRIFGRVPIGGMHTFHPVQSGEIVASERILILHNRIRFYSTFCTNFSHISHGTVGLFTRLARRINHTMNIFTINHFGCAFLSVYACLHSLPC